MFPLNDPRWHDYTNAMGGRGDVASIMRELLDTGASPRIWDACWNFLVYQDAIGQVSYAAVPYLAAFTQNSPQIDWNALALISAIELARPGGPDFPVELEHDYHSAIQSMPMILARHPQVKWDELTTRCAVSCIALARGQRQLAKAYFDLSLQEAVAWLNDRDR